MMSSTMWGLSCPAVMPRRTHAVLLSCAVKSLGTVVTHGEWLTGR
jgi:hypothetical protein